MTTIPYIHFTDEQKQRAATVDLPEFLRRQGEKLLPSGREYRLGRDHSITVRASSWYDHAAGRGGGPISFVQNFYDLSYPEAVSRLLDDEQELVCSPTPKQEEQPRKDFALPPANDNMRRVYAYLLKRRLLDRDVLTAFAKTGLLYESCEKYNDREIHNAVFVGKDEHGVARHAHKRSVNDIGKSFRINITYFVKMCARLGNLAAQFGPEKYIGRAESLAEQTRGLLEEDNEAYFARTFLRLNWFEANIFRGRTTDHQKEVQEIFQSAWGNPGNESNECLSRAGILPMNWIHSDTEIADIREKLRSRLDQAHNEEENGPLLAQAYLRSTVALKKAAGDGLFSKEEIEDAYAVMLRYPESENTRAAFQMMLEHSTEAGNWSQYLRREVVTAAATYERYHPDPEMWMDDPDELPFGLPEQLYRREHRKIGANEPCPCGSGKKFKKCCRGNGKYD